VRYLIKSILLVVFIATTTTANSVKAIEIGNQTCNNVWTLYDYYDGPNGTGNYLFSAWESTGVNCYDNGSGVGPGDGWWNDPGMIGFWDWLFPEAGPESIPNDPTNPFKAKCSSDEYSRFEHANQDVKTYVGGHMASGQGRPLNPGDIVEVTYDDGSTEQWVAFGLSGTAQIQDKPVDGSLKCK
jgi:hypothetical protein